MKNLTIFFCVSAISLFFRVSQTRAFYDPRALPNNIFGIHIADLSDIPAAANLVNVSRNDEADWGYVTIVISEHDRDSKDWSEIFKKLRNYHLIPIIRIATSVKNSVWVRPNEKDISVWVDFLNSLPWPVENRYIILWNEPNHAKEWGGSVDPKGYADITNAMMKSLRQKNQNFFIMPAGLDLYSQNSNVTMKAEHFWDQMEVEIPGIISEFDGWASHSYPPSDFTGSPNVEGKHSITGYRWEIQYVSENYGVRKNIPVFITETGWKQTSKLSRKMIADYYSHAFQDIWGKDPLIVAVTPFLLNYQDDLFGRFSWKKMGSDEYYLQYSVVRKMDKVLGQPITVPLSKFGKILVDERRNLLKNLQASLLQNSR